MSLQSQSQDDLKRNAARAALAYLTPKLILGLGTGSTVEIFIEELAQAKFSLQAVVASSANTAKLIEALGIPVIDLNSLTQLSLYIDGADEVAPDLKLIKGAGGALTREKILAKMADEFICIVDESKMVKVLGQAAVPVEVIPLARSYVARVVETMGGRPVYRQGFVTDNGNHILDVHGLPFSDPAELETSLKAITGIVDNGIFAHRKADTVIVGSHNGTHIYP